VGADTNPFYLYTDLQLTRLLILLLLTIHNCLAQPLFAFACDSSPGLTVTPYVLCPLSLLSFLYRLRQRARTRRTKALEKTE